MRRRTFLSGSLLTMAGMAVSGKAAAATAAAAPGKTEKKGIDFAHPTLQCPAATSMGVVWAWRSGECCSGWVEYAEKPDFSGKKTAYAIGPSPFRMVSKQILSAQIRGLKPNTRYFYRTVTCENPGGKNEKIHAGEGRAFTTLGPGGGSSFAVINDTHVHMKTFPELFKRIDALNPAVTLWNGDVCNYLYYESNAYSLLQKYYGEFPFAAERPFLYVPGNHDYRGDGARKLKEVMITRIPDERPGRFADMDRNFAVRAGEIAMVGLDTTEDKWDRHFGGLTAFEPYMARQTDWLAYALELPEIKKAPYLLVFTHIPLFHPQALKNPDIQMHGYPDWHPPCSRMWSPLLKAHGVQAVISAHTHVYASYKPSAAYPWHQIVGGGPSIPEATVIDGKVRNGALEITSFGFGRNNVLETFTFKPRG